jgi:hypothetical protein
MKTLFLFLATMVLASAGTVPINFDTSTGNVVNVTGTTVVNFPSGKLSVGGTTISSYTLPIATTSILGGVKPDGTTITITGSGVVSANGGIPQGGPLTQDLDFNGFAAENVSTITAVSFIGAGDGLTFDGAPLGEGVAFALTNGVNGSNGLLQLGDSGDLVVVGSPASSGNGTITLSNQSLSSTFQFGTLESVAVLAPGEFVIVDVVGGTVPFVIAPGAPTTSLTIDSVGTVSVLGNSLNSLFDGTSNLSISTLGIGGGIATGILGSSGQLVTSGDSISGIAAFQSDGSLAQAVPGVDYITPTGSETLTNKSIAATQMTGTVATVNLGSGTASNTTFLRGDQTYATPLTGTTVYAGNFSGSGTATTSFVVTIGHTMANTNYTACVTPVNTLSSAVFNVSAKSTTQFTVTYLAGLTGTVSFDWNVTPFN